MSHNMSSEPVQDAPGIGTYIGDGVFITILDQNGFRTPIELCPEDHGQIIFISDIYPSETPAPFRYETAPLHWAIQHADKIVVLPFAPGDQWSPPRAHASDQTRKILAMDAYLDAAHRKENTLFVCTLWQWLAPWETVIQRAKLPGTVVLVVDHAGERSIRSRSTARPVRSPRRRDHPLRKG